MVLRSILIDCNDSDGVSSQKNSVAQKRLTGGSNLTKKKQEIAENTFLGISQQKIHVWGQNFTEMLIGGGGGLQMGWKRFFPPILVKRHKNDAM